MNRINRFRWELGMICMPWPPTTVRGAWHTVVMAWRESAR